MKLRNYQEDIVDAVIKHHRTTGKECCVFSPTGSGKSVMIYELVRSYVEDGVSACVMVNISKLIPQLSELFNRMGIKHNIVKAGYEIKHDDCLVHLMMQQTMASRKELKPKCDVLLVDERHISFGSSTMVEIENRLKPSKIISFSATPLDGDNLPLKGLDIIGGISVKELTERGFLTPVRTFVAEFSQKLDLSEVDSKAGDYNENQLAKVINTKEYNQEVVSNWIQRAGDLKTVVFATGVNHCENLRDEFILAGYEARAIHSKMNQKDIEATFEAFSNDEFQVLVSIGMISTGWDEPSVQCGVSCRPTKSLKLYLQQVGRLCRTNENKTEAIWLDFAKNTEEHGLYDEEIDFSPIDNSDKRAVKARRSQRNIKDIDLLVQDKKELVELVSRSDIKLQVEEIKRTKRLGSVKDLIDLFMSSMDIREIMDLALQIDEKLNGRTYKPTTANWICTEWERYFEIEPHNQVRWTKAFKTMAKNIIQSGKTSNPKLLSGMFYRIAWLYENQSNSWFR